MERLASTLFGKTRRVLLYSPTEEEVKSVIRSTDAVLKKARAWIKTNRKDLAAS